MRRFFLAAMLFALVGTSVALAGDPPIRVAQPGQPKVIPIQPPLVQPIPPWGMPNVARLEEEVESLQAHRDTKKAYVRAAEIALRVAELNFERIEKLVRLKAVTNEEADKAKLEVLAAQAQVEIRVAEMKEVEVKIKHAMKRVDEARGGIIRPKIIEPKTLEKLPNPKPPIELKNPLAEIPPEVLDELKKKLTEVEKELTKEKITGLERRAADKKNAAEKAAATSKEATAALVALVESAKLGRVAAGTIEKAEARAKDAQVAAERARAELVETETVLAEAKARLKELEK